MLRLLTFALLLFASALAGCRGEAPPPPPPERPEPVAPASDVARPPQAVDPWVAPGPQGGTTALFVTLTGGSVPDTLVSAFYAGAQVTEIHETVETDGMRGMRALRTLPLAAADTVRLEPGGLHLMLVSLSEALAPGDTVRVDLRFARGGTVPVEALVRAPR